MRFLVLGGTAWLGRCIASAAVESGDDVTCLARGVSGDAPDGAVFVSADRGHDVAYDDLAGEQWDVVVDVARQPGHVRGAVQALAGRTGLYAFVSSCSVYADHGTPGQDESAALLEPLQSDVMETMESYGEAKVACERHVLEGMGRDGALIARAGLIGGPGDVSDRSGYWPQRFARPASEGGAVLVPDAPDLFAQVIDVRDLADWIVDAAHRGVSGTFNLTGHAVPFPKFVETARAVARHTGPIVRADARWLLSQGVQEWMGPESLPVWLADPALTGLNAADGSRAREAGLVHRPLHETLADTLAWEKTRDPARARQAGVSDPRERALLETLAYCSSVT